MRLRIIVRSERTILFRNDDFYPLGNSFAWFSETELTGVHFTNPTNIVRIRWYGHIVKAMRSGQDKSRGNDRATAESPRRMLNITRDTGEFLSVLVRATSARRVLELETSNG